MLASRCSLRAAEGSRKAVAVCRSLPFEPMALITLDKLHQCLAAPTPAAKSSEAGVAARTLASHTSKALPSARQTLKPGKGTAAHVSVDTQQPALVPWSSKDSATDWFGQGLPFFVSPKHDGIRLVSFTQPALSGGQQRRARGEKPSATCFSRYGRPIHGLSWIESELALLRALADDPALALDGELYLHKEAPAAPPRAASARTKVSVAVRHRRGRHSKAVKTSRSAQADDITSAESPGSATAATKTGFLAVNALMTRLRGSSSRCATVGEVLQYVDALPSMCIFDVIAYTPALRAPTGTAGRGNSAKAHLSQSPEWVRECERIRSDAMAAHGVRSLECLQCTPNITPFSLRLRALFFLADMLERALESPTLCAHFHLSRPQSSAAKASSSLVTSYKGGDFVKAVPYALSHSLETVEKKVLPSYTKRGYEGVVLRAPNNLYELREKQKGVLQMLVRPLEEQARAVLRRTAGRSGRAPRQHLTCHRFCLEEDTDPSRPKRRASQGIYRAYGTNSESVSAPVTGGSSRVARGGARVALPVDDLALDAVDPRVQEETEALGTLSAAALAVRRAKLLPPRSFTVAKVLPFKDTEYTVLRPLLKAPSTNPRTRPLATMQTANGPVVFYGLQCLAENGRVFNVSLPKMKMADQQALLKHLTSVSAKKNKGKGDPSSLTGLYVTVKYGALTEYGVPRFGTVKAIRGGKGWFM